MKRLHLDKIASATARIDIATEALIGDQVVSEAGYIVAVKALDRKAVYNQLETRAGRFVQIYPGDIIAGVLGERRALLGHAGVVPESIQVGDELHLLNLGGVIGQCTSSNPMVGPPLRVEVLGAVLAFPVLDSRVGVPAHIGMNALPPVETLGPTPPVVFVSGTCMNSGKTLAACEIVRALVRHGLRVGVVKLTGVALRRDTLAMLDCGATRALSFCDAGYPSTNAETAPKAARAALAALVAPGESAVDVIVAELGDGLLGEYGVLPILTQPDILDRPVVHVCCAADPVGAFGAMEVFKTRIGGRPHVFSGPVTDNQVGCDQLQKQLGVAAFNARLSPDRLGQAVIDALAGRDPLAANTQEEQDAAEVLHHVAV